MEKLKNGYLPIFFLKLLLQTLLGQRSSSAGSKGRCQVPRFLVSGSRFRVPGVQLPGVRCQVPGVRCRVRRFKRKVQTYFTSQRKLQTYRHIFHYPNFLYGNVKIVYSYSKIKARFRKIKKKSQLSAM